ncbi:MAG: metallophosphoesterase [Pseudobdellovibrionaceae bacterium]
MIKEPFDTSASEKKPPHTIYAIGDVHGYDDALLKLLTKIHRDIDRIQGFRPDATFEIVLLGDFESRGPNTKGVLDIVSNAKVKSRGMGVPHIALFGNHDYATRSFLKENDPQKIIEKGCALINYGALQTFASYGVFAEENHNTSRPVHTPKGANFSIAHEDILRMHKEMMDVMPFGHLALLNSLKYSHHSKHDPAFFFCHAGVDPEKDWSEQDAGVLLGYGSDEDIQIGRNFVKGDGAKDIIVVHGHTIVKAGEVRSGRISIDTGIYEDKQGDRRELTCAVLRGGAFKKFITAKSDYPPYDPNFVPTEKNWPPVKNPQTGLDTLDCKL